MALQKSLHKDEIRSSLLRQNALGPKPRALVLIDIADSDIREFLLEAAPYLEVACVVATGSDQEKSEYSGYDAFITDTQGIHLDIPALVQNTVVPILPIDTAFSKSFSEFDPMKFTGNAFLFTTENKYLIFEKLIRYLENIRYVGDKRTLLTNIAKTF